MEKAELLNCYSAACQKALENAQKIGTDLREFPGRPDGDYFALPSSSLRPVEHIFCWTPSFFTGMALLAGQQNADFAPVRWVESLYEPYRRKVFDTPADTMHDLGFMYTLYSTFCWKLTGDEKMRELSVRAAEVLAHRFVPNGGYLRAWGRMDDSIPDYIEPELRKDNFFAHSQGLAIIDCMMNIPLLFWAGKETGDPFFTNVAVAHADTTLKYFIRPDGSVCHAYRFDPETGAPLEEFNDCGYAVGSHWARGTAWAVYGFALAWKYTGFERYRDAARTLAYAYFDQCPQNGIPVWDFRLPKEQPARAAGRWQEWTRWDISDSANCDKNVDSSAAAIMCCGLLEFLDLEEDERMRRYVEKAAETLLRSYINLDVRCPGLLRRQNGCDGYASYGDYFAMELMARLLNKDGLPW